MVTSLRHGLEQLRKSDSSSLALPAPEVTIACMRSTERQRSSQLVIVSAAPIVPVRNTANSHRWANERWKRRALAIRRSGWWSSALRL